MTSLGEEFISLVLDTVEGLKFSDIEFLKRWNLIPLSFIVGWI